MIKFPYRDIYIFALRYRRNVVYKRKRITILYKNAWESCKRIQAIYYIGG